MLPPGPCVLRDNPPYRPIRFTYCFPFSFLSLSNAFIITYLGSRIQQYILGLRKAELGSASWNNIYPSHNAYFSEKRPQRHRSTSTPIRSPYLQVCA
mgnify:CR=1 FL=1